MATITLQFDDSTEDLRKLPFASNEHYFVRSLGVNLLSTLAERVHFYRDPLPTNHILVLAAPLTMMIYFLSQSFMY